VSATTSYGEGSSSLLRPPKRATSSAFWRRLPIRVTGRVRRVGSSGIVRTSSRKPSPGRRRSPLTPRYRRAALGTTITIRPAEPPDVQLIFSLIVELAEYERPARR